ncbi:MAG: hypothetical protein KAT90_15650, partial [Gammaproteobacteria bacterium]|nr:hypothetical protein [Gammaproteobacteria bacterium]
GANTHYHQSYELLLKESKQYALPHRSVGTRNGWHGNDKNKNVGKGLPTYKIDIDSSQKK